MKTIAIAAARIRVCEVRWTFGSCAAASSDRVHRSASTRRGRNWPTSSTISALEDEEGRAQRRQEGAAAGPLQHPHRHLLHPQPLPHRQLQRLDLGEVRRVVLAEQRHHPPVGRPHPARRVGEALPRRQRQEEAEDAGADPPRDRRPVVVALRLRRAALAVARPDHQVGPPRRHLLQQPRHLRRRVLAVGVEVGAAVVALAQRVEVAGLQRRPQPLVEGQRGDERARLARPRARSRRSSRRRPRARRRPGRCLAHVPDHLRDRVLLVPGRDEDQRSHPPILPCRPASVCVSKRS